MSLDVYLYETIKCPKCGTYAGSGQQVFSRNITHNLNKMAEAAGLYKTLWRPEEEYAEYALQIIPNLELGLIKLLTDPIKYKAYNPENGWGNYDIFVEFITTYLSACKTYPNAKIEVSR